LRALNRRFGNAAETARPLVESVSKLQTLEALFDAALDAPSLEAFQTQAQSLLRRRRASKRND
ncbi:MAG: hypothetical protein NZM28_06375, partial [Fimbriimonadales bacterium]|nr:hypothetical protein [Fimbriimonadales bacterium]